MLAVLAEHQQCRRGVADPDRLDHCPVLGRDDIAVVLLVVVNRAVHLGRVPQQADQPHQARKGARFDEGEMETPVRGRHRHHVRGVSGRLHVALSLLEPIDVLGGHLGHGDGDGLGLEELADPVDFQQVRQGQLGDEVATVGQVGDLSLALENLQRLAQRDPADTELLADPRVQESYLGIG